MMKDIMGKGGVSEKEINAETLGDLKKYKKKSYKKKDHEKTHEDHDGKYIDDYAHMYHKTRYDIHDAIDRSKDSKHRSYNRKYDSEDLDDRVHSHHNFDSEYLDDFSSRHLSEEEWTLKEKKEQENLNELIAKEKEL